MPAESIRRDRNYTASLGNVQFALSLHAGNRKYSDISNAHNRHTCIVSTYSRIRKFGSRISAFQAKTIA